MDILWAVVIVFPLSAVIKHVLKLWQNNWVWHEWPVNSSYVYISYNLQNDPRLRLCWYIVSILSWLLNGLQHKLMSRLLAPPGDLSSGPKTLRIPLALHKMICISEFFLRISSTPLAWISVQMIAIRKIITRLSHTISSLSLSLSNISPMSIICSLTCRK